MPHDLCTYDDVKENISFLALGIRLVPKRERVKATVAFIPESDTFFKRIKTNNMLSSNPDHVYRILYLEWPIYKRLCSRTGPKPMSSNYLTI